MSLKTYDTDGYTAIIPPHRKIIGAYRIIDSFGNIKYTGSSSDLLRRYVNSVNALKMGSYHNTAMQDFYNNNPFITFIFKQTNTREEAYLLEQRDLDTLFNNGLLLNKAKYAKDSFKELELTSETREKLRHAKLNNKNALGHTVSEYSKKLMSLSNIGRKKTPEEIDKLRNNMFNNNYATGTIRSKETKERISNSLLGRKKTNKHIEKVAASKRIAVIIDNIRHKSAKHASEILNIKASTIRFRCLSKTFPNWKYSETNQGDNACSISSSDQCNLSQLQD